MAPALGPLVPLPAAQVTLASMIDPRSVHVMPLGEEQNLTSVEGGLSGWRLL